MGPLRRGKKPSARASVCVLDFRPVLSDLMQQKAQDDQDKGLGLQLISLVLDVARIVLDLANILL